MAKLRVLGAPAVEPAGALGGKAIAAVSVVLRSRRRYLDCVALR